MQPSTWHKTKKNYDVNVRKLRALLLDVFKSTICFSSENVQTSDTSYIWDYNTLSLKILYMRLQH